MNKFFVIIFLCTYVIAEEFPITNDAGEKPLQDPFTKEIYYYTDYTNIVKKLSPDLQSVEITYFPSLPYFSKSSHVASFQGSPAINELYLYDFDEQSSSLLDIIYPDSLIASNRKLSFSPLSQRILIKDIGAGYYSFADSSIHYVNPGMSTLTESIFWGNSDNEIFYHQHSGNSILRYNYNTQTVDTILTSDSSFTITTFDYNLPTNIIAYVLDTGGQSDVHLFDISTLSDTCIYDGSEWGSLGGFILNISFHPDGQRLVFSAFLMLGSDDGPLFFYDLQNDTLIATDILMGPKKDFLWLSKDTVIYSKGWQYGLYGYRINDPNYIENDISYISKSIRLYQNYPNPFNSTTNIKFELLEKSNVEIDIFSINGKKVKSIVKTSLVSGVYNYNWDATNELNYTVSTGVYFIRLSFTNARSNGHIEKKILYIK